MEKVKNHRLHSGGNETFSTMILCISCERKVKSLKGKLSCLRGKVRAQANFHRETDNRRRIDHYDHRIWNEQIWKLRLRRPTSCHCNNTVVLRIIRSASIIPIAYFFRFAVKLSLVSSYLVEKYPVRTCKKIEKNMLCVCVCVFDTITVIDVIEKIIAHDCNAAIISVPACSTHMRIPCTNYAIIQITIFVP